MYSAQRDLCATSSPPQTKCAYKDNSPDHVCGAAICKCFYCCDPSKSPTCQNTTSPPDLGDCKYQSCSSQGKLSCTFRGEGYCCPNDSSTTCVPNTSGRPYGYPTAVNDCSPTPVSNSKEGFSVSSKSKKTILYVVITVVVIIILLLLLKYFLKESGHNF